MFKIPAIEIFDSFLENSLLVHKLLHLIGVFINRRVTKAIIDLFKFRDYLNCLFHSLLNNFPDSPGLIKKRILRKMAYGIAWTKSDLALILFFHPGNDP